MLTSENTVTGRPRGGLPLLILCLIAAFIAWYFLFAVPGVPFWTLIAGATFILGGGTLLVYPDTLRASPKSWIRYSVIGIVSAVALYFIFFAGDKIVSLLPFGSEQIDAVYGTRDQASKTTILTLLLFSVGPGEELFWRGWVQRSLSRRFGPWKGYFAALSLYILLHLPSMNLTLMAAAGTAGAVWGLIYMKTGHIGPGMISHTLWDAVIFVIFPLS